MNAPKAKKEASQKGSCDDSGLPHLYLSKVDDMPNHTGFISPVNKFLGMLRKQPGIGAALPKGFFLHFSS